ncbi:MAG TPA: hypothetical protein VJ306_10540 [Pyrinomonadaceae bacterium]|nr:hypothetical protein [Pyrinomonadaceae bacterium]
MKYRVDGNAIDNQLVENLKLKEANRCSPKLIENNALNHAANVPAASPALPRPT